MSDDIFPMTLRQERNALLNIWRQKLQRQNLGHPCPAQLPHAGDLGIVLDSTLRDVSVKMMGERQQAGYRTRAQARREICEYLEVWYNRQQLHSALGYLTPIQCEQRLVTV